MNLPSDLQRFLPYIAVAVLAVVGVVLVMRGVSPGGSTPEPSRIDQGGEVRGGGEPGRGSEHGGTTRDGGSGGAGRRAQTKRSAQAYIACVQQATNTAALEKCQAFLP